MLDHAGPIRTGEDLDVLRLEAYLKPLLPNASAGFSIEQFPSGHSNLTYLMNAGGQEYVLRRPPFGNPVKSAHDMGREYRVLSKLCEVYPPAPRPFVWCQDHDIIGDEFYVMERRRGVVLRSDNPPEELTFGPQIVRRLSEAFIDNLADLHTLDFAAAGLGDLGRPAGYVQRQVTGWNKRYRNAQTDELPEVEQLGNWLADHLPEDGSPALIHNDYKYDNIMLEAADLTKIVAVLDWEMATIGDPLMDLGAALSYWVEPEDSEEMRRQAFGPTMLPGSLTRKQLVARYADRTGVDIPDMLYYYCFGLFKLAVILQQIYARYARGKTQDTRFAALNSRVAALGRAGAAAIEAGSV